MCDEATEVCPCSLVYIPDWFVTREGYTCGMMTLIIMIKIIVFKWYDGYQKRRPQKSIIKEELSPIA